MSIQHTAYSIQQTAALTDPSVIACTVTLSVFRDSSQSKYTYNIYTHTHIHTYTHTHIYTYSRVYMNHTTYRPFRHSVYCNFVSCEREQPVEVPLLTYTHIHTHTHTYTHIHTYTHTHIFYLTDPSVIACTVTLSVFKDSSHSKYPSSLKGMMVRR
jgi:hypothetical protein